MTEQSAILWLRFRLHFPTWMRKAWDSSLTKIIIGEILGILFAAQFIALVIKGTGK